jgi:hypothetical protein
MSRRVLETCIVAAALTTGLGSASAQQPAAHVAVTPAEVKWGEPPPSLRPGAKFAVVSGNPAASGSFTIRLRLPAGYRIAPHWHPTDEHVTVLSGVWAVGMGEKFDTKVMKDLPAGGFGAMPAEMRHFALAKSDVVVQVHGQGPFVVNYVNPADDPGSAAAGHARGAVAGPAREK